MNYRKGDFTVVPNLGALKGQNPSAQLLFMWLCTFADSDGICFPSRETLVACTGLSMSAVRDHTKTLVDLGLLTVVERKTEAGGNRSNLYQIMLKSEGGGSPESLGGGVSGKGGGVSQGATNYTHINYTKTGEDKSSLREITSSRQTPSISTAVDSTADVVVEEVDDEGNPIKRIGRKGRQVRIQNGWSWDIVLESLKNSPKRLDKIVALYLVHKGRTYSTQMEWESERKGFLKAALPLEKMEYSRSELSEAFDFMDYSWKQKDWSLFNVPKYAKDARDGNLAWPINRNV